MGKVKEFAMRAVENADVDSLIDALIQRAETTNELLFADGERLTKLNKILQEEIESSVAGLHPLEMPPTPDFAPLVGKIVLREWTILHDNRLAGIVYDDPRFKDGTYIRTSPITLHDTEKQIAVTRSGTIYNLRDGLQSAA